MTVQSEEAVAEAPEAGSPVFRRILLKLSGESLMGAQEYGMDRATIDAIAEEIVEVQASGVETGIVVGAGNIYRGMCGCRRRHGPRDGRLLRDARDGAELAGRSRTRSRTEAPTRGCSPRSR